MTMTSPRNRRNDMEYRFGTLGEYLEGAKGGTGVSKAGTSNVQHPRPNIEGDAAGSSKCRAESRYGSLRRRKSPMGKSMTINCGVYDEIEKWQSAFASLRHDKMGSFGNFLAEFEPRTRLRQTPARRVNTDKHGSGKVSREQAEGAELGWVGKNIFFRLELVGFSRNWPEKPS